MAGKSTISITFKLDGDSKEFKTLINDAAGLKKVLRSTVSEADQLKKSLISWSQGVQAIESITNMLGNASSAMQEFSGRMKSVQANNIAITQLTGKTGEEMLKLRNSVQSISEYFGMDFNETLRAANSLSKGFGISAEDALKLVRDGLVSGANAGGDFIDTVREYPRYFREAGISAEEFIAITTNASKQGIFSDKGVDVIKEGNLRIREMTTATAAALDNIGISSTEVQQALQQGSLTTFQVMQMVAAKLKELPASSAAVGTAIADIFGGPGEDAGLEYIKTLDGIKLNMEAIKAATNGTAEQQERQIQVQEDLKNSLSSIIDLSSLYTDVAPYVELTSQVGMTALGVGSLIKTIKAMNVQHLIFATRTKASGVAMAMFGLKASQATAFTRVFSGAMKTGAYSATAFKLALKGLMITTVIGAAIAGLTTLIEHLCSTTEEATDKVDDLQDAEDTFKQTAADVKVELDNEISTLSRLISSNQDTTAAVQRLNEKYGEAFGVYKTASEWYDVLTRKSSAYAKQVGYEAQARALATKIAEKELALELNAEKQRQLQKAGEDKTRKLRTYTYSDAAGNTNVGLRWENVDSDAMVKAKNEAKQLSTSVADLEKQLGIVQKKLATCAAEMTTVTGVGKDQNKALKVSEMTWQQVSDAIDETEKKLKNTTDKKQIANLRAYNNQLKKRKQLLESSTGLGGGGSSGSGKKEGKDTPVWDDNASTLKGITDNIEILNQKLEKANLDEAALINQQIAAWQKKAEAIKKAGQAAEDNTPLWKEDAATLKDINANIEILTQKLETATTEEAVLINQQIAAWEKKADAIKNAGLSEDPGPMFNATAQTLKEIGDNIEILNGQLETATLEEAALINQQIAAWEKKADAIKNAGLETVKTGELVKKSLADSWSSIKGISGSIENATAALQGNGTAWQKTISLIDSFVGLYQGIQTIVGIIKMLSAASAAHAATKAVETTAETTNATVRAAAATTTAASSAAVIVANKLEAASWKELAAAEYMAAHAYIPFAGYGIAAGFTAAMLATVTAAGIPALADGGIASGPTLAMVGEYAGASGNPEVIAPLDKLRSLLPGEVASGPTNLEFRIKGDDLVAVYNRRTNKVRRT